MTQCELCWRWVDEKKIVACTCEEDICQDCYPEHFNEVHIYDRDEDAGEEDG